MSVNRLLFYFWIPAVVLLAGPQPWKDKAIADWTGEDTQLVLTDSPWSKSVQPTLDGSASSGRRPSRGLGHGGGINLGGIGIGLPGIGGMGRRGGGYPGGGYPGGPSGNGNGGGPADSGQAPVLHLRWESALPVRAAELKAREDAPTLDENHYAIAVYGVPGRFLPDTPERAAKELKKLAAIKRDGKPDLKPSSVEVIPRNDGTVVVYLFPRTREITRRDKRVAFDAEIGRLRFSQSFFIDDMVFQGKMEL